jgi:mediator of RNA polymerase II transcription subunit 17
LKLYRKENPSARLSANLRRIFLERGYNFFDKASENGFTSEDSQSQTPNVAETAEAGEEDDHDDEPKVMTYEDLRGMREDILGNLM